MDSKKNRFIIVITILDKKLSKGTCKIKVAFKTLFKKVQNISELLTIINI